MSYDGKCQMPIVLWLFPTEDRFVFLTIIQKLWIKGNASKKEAKERKLK